jgi:uncharacterized membrane protein YkvA (DUF1232 family)
MAREILLAFGTVIALYTLFIGVLFAIGRKQDARAWAGLIPDCIILFKMLMSDPKVPRSRKWMLALLIGYLSLPFDIVPDFIPIAGQLDDAVIVALVLRSILHSVGEEDVRRNWPGPERSINQILCLVNWRKKQTP